MNAAAGSRLTLVLGGVRSGKSVFAEERLIANARTAQMVYIATAQLLDDEIRERVARHRARRGPQWQTIEAPIRVTDVIRGHGDATTPILLDSLGMWLNNLLFGEHDLDAALDNLLESLAATSAPVTIVSDELGLGGIADSALGRQFADRLGLCNQRIAAVADEVFLVVAGIGVRIKGA